MSIGGRGLAFDARRAIVANASRRSAETKASPVDESDAPNNRAQVISDCGRWTQLLLVGSFFEWREDPNMFLGVDFARPETFRPGHSLG